jgi:hypothetical protein
MQAQVIDSLPKSRVSDPSFRIWQETEGGIDEKLTAVFLYALKTHARDYLPKENPGFPVGFESDHSDYLMVDPADKSKAWKVMLEKYKGYFERLFEVKADNLSNLNFLREAKAHFEKIGMTGNALKVEALIARFG